MQVKKRGISTKHGNLILTKGKCDKATFRAKINLNSGCARHQPYDPPMAIKAPVAVKKENTTQKEVF